MIDRQEYFIRFLRGCARAADAKELGVVQGHLLINGDLMREVADEFERVVLFPEPERETFKNTTDELHYHLVRAEHHARQAHDLLYAPEGPKRSVWFKMTAGRAQSILMSLYKQEGRRS